LHDDDEIDLCGRTLQVLHIPGHSPGHVAYWDAANHVLFTGDTAQMGPLFACFEGSDPVAFARSVKRLAALEDVKTICPGHNEIITLQGWLGELATAVEAVVAGKVVGQTRDEFIVGREFSFGHFLCGCQVEASQDLWPLGHSFLVPACSPKAASLTYTCSQVSFRS
jgi:glyoxylase-like metal-dependent hydrolase (beta-lactamase superfamily II)